MSKQSVLDRRLTRAEHEAADADRIWRQAMARNVDVQTEDADVRRRLDALWQERERAHSRVLELQWLAYSRAERLVSLRARLHSTRVALAVLKWHIGRRLGSASLRRPA